MSKEKYSRFFQFLKEFYQLRERTVKDFTVSRKYLHHCWLSEMEEYQGAKTSLWSDEEMDEESLILTLPRLRRPIEPEKPEMDEAWSVWLTTNPYDWTEAPTIKEQIEQYETIHLWEDQPEEFKEDLIDFLDELSEWRPEEQEYQKELAAYKRDLKVYDRFFDASNKQSSFPERYELVLGTGLCHWASPHQIKRPLVVTPLEIEITDSGMIRISLSAEGDLFSIENDFLSSITGLSVSNATSILEQHLQQEEADFWAVLYEYLEDGLEAFANHISSEAEYKDSDILPEEHPDGLTIYLTHVIMFRERNLRSFTALFESILEHLNLQQEEASNISLLDRIAYPLDQLPGGHVHRDWGVNMEDIVLPKESNAEQMRIAERIGKKDIVVVQGPPGTGKSHTIANIITYLLSQGKKILVTAQTDQALKALQAHLPEEFLDLVIYFLQGSSRKDNELSKSVRQLQDSIDFYQPGRIQDQIKKDREELQQLREKRAGLLNDIETLQYADIRPAYLNELYQEQTLPELIDRLQKEEAEFGWMKDSLINLSEALALSPNLLEWHELYCTLNRAQFSPSAQSIPNLSLLPDAEALKRLKSWERAYQEKYAGQVLIPKADITTDELKALVAEFKELKTALPQGQSWHKKAQNDLQHGQVGYWIKLSQRSEQLLQELDSLQVDQLVRNYEVWTPDSVSARQLKSDTKVVWEYVKAGKKLKGLMKSLTLAKEIKERRYIFEECRVNNHLCLREQELAILTNYSAINLVMTEMDELWNDHQATEKDYRLKFEKYKAYGEQLKGILRTYPTYLAIQNKLCGIFHQATDFFEQGTALFQLEDAIKAFQLKEDIRQLRIKVEEASEYLRSLENEPEITKLHRGLTSLDPVIYEEAWQYFSELSRLRDLYQKMETHEELLSLVFPNTIAYIKEDQVQFDLDEQQVESAIYWSNARYELSSRFEESVDDKYKALAHCDEDIRDTAATCLKGKATHSFIENLKAPEELNRLLTRWSQAVKLANGKGKRAFSYRIVAQKLLQNISKDIPCWIMPIYRLADTLGPRPETFDVVIIDEASQLGPEALFLNYITKKIIVVGDDQQTAPENVGVPIAAVVALIKKFLWDFPAAVFFDTKHSFFDHKSAIAGQRITLREHFRCMPEIIEFSNQLCYRDNGIDLIPLKQFSSHRLPPLQTHFVPNGTFNNNVNKPEARAIVKKIKELLQDEAYEGKTFGVIALQGPYQSIEIDRLLRANISPKEFYERRIVCGTPPDFQGDERDVMFLSLVTAPDHKRTALTKDNYKRRFNVAMSRAKEQVWLFHSVQENDITNPNDLRYQLLHYFKKGSTSEIKEELVTTGDRLYPPKKPFDSWFEIDIYLAITKRGYYVEPQYNVGPYRIDLVVHLQNGKKIAIECDGDRYHEGEDLRRDIERQLILERAGWEFFRIRWSHFKYEPEASLEKLWFLLETRASEATKLAGPKTTTNVQASATPNEAVQKASISEAEAIPEINVEPTGESKSYGSEAIETFSENSAIETFDILLFTDQATVYRHTGLSKREAQEFDINDSFRSGENVIYKIITSEYSGFMIFGYKNGKVDRVPLSAYQASRSVLQNAYHKRQKLIFIRHFQKDTYLAGITKEKKVLVFSTDQISEHQSRGNQGNQVFKSGSKMKKFKPLEDTKLKDPSFYKRSSLNSVGYYLKKGDSV